MESNYLAAGRQILIHFISTVDWCCIRGKHLLLYLFGSLGVRLEREETKKLKAAFGYCVSSVY